MIHQKWTYPYLLSHGLHKLHPLFALFYSNNNNNNNSTAAQINDQLCN